jgi:alpha-1,2-mannosyltransferase
VEAAGSDGVRGASRRLSFDAQDALRLACIAWLALVGFLLLATIAERWDDDASFTHRDFHAFWLGATRMRAGESPYAHDAQPFLFPPHAAMLVLPLGWLSERAGFVALDVLGAIALVLGVFALARRVGLAAREAQTAALCAWAWPAWIFTAYLGQLSGLIVGGTAAALALVLGARTPARDLACGALIAALTIKPQLSLALLVVLALTRAWRALAAAVALIAVLVAVGYALLGPGAYAEWRALVAWWSDALEAAPGTWWRQFTLYAFVRGAGAMTGAGQGAARAVTAALGVPIVVMGFAVVRRALAKAEPLLTVRAMGLVVLATVALNGYLFYYDALLLVVPALAVFAARGTYAGWARGVAIGCAALSWILCLATPLFAQGSVPLPGLVASAWLVVELVDLARRVRAPEEAAA